MDLFIIIIFNIEFYRGKNPTGTKLNIRRILETQDMLKSKNITTSSSLKHYKHEILCSWRIWNGYMMDGFIIPNEKELFFLSSGLPFGLMAFL